MPLRSGLILLVDDDPDWRGVIREVLARHHPGVEVEEASSGAEALMRLRHNPPGPAGRPDLICLDLEMPGLSGLEALTAVKAFPELSDIPVMVLSGAVEDEVRDAVAEAGAVAFVQKCSDLHTIADAIADALPTGRPEVPLTSTLSAGGEATGAVAAEAHDHEDPCPRVLVVDDDPDHRTLLLETLAMAWPRADHSRLRGAATAAECLAEDLTDFDLILLDYHLPDMPGLELLTRILARQDLPVIFVTGENDSATAAAAIKRGAGDYVVKRGDYLFAIPAVINKSLWQHRIRQENARLQERLRQSLEELARKNRQLEQSLHRLQQMAATDPLTNLANRRHFRQMLDRSFHEAVRYGFNLTCCMMDLDHYKQLNDSLGHQFGDEILVLTARIIRETLRDSDIAARYGGDELVLLLPHTSADRALAVCQRIRGDMAAATKAHPKLGRAVTMSIGMASLFGNKPGSADALVSMADKALYTAKDRGKDQIAIYAKGPDDHVLQG